MVVVHAGERAEDPADLVEVIATALASREREYREYVPTDDPDDVGGENRVALVRSCGRKAGRQLGVKTQTLVVASHAGDGPDAGARIVYVVNTERLNPDNLADQVADIYRRQQMRAAVHGLSTGLQL